MDNILNHLVLWLPRIKEVREIHYLLVAMELMEEPTLPITIIWRSQGKTLKNQLNQVNLGMVGLMTT
jgi:hypothetical protein